jgi:flagellin
MSVINTNVQATASARTLNRSQEMLGRSLNRLSSGSKIVNPSDDAAGLAVSEKLDAQNRRVRAASTNVQNAVSLTQVTDGFMASMGRVLGRMSELAILAHDVTKSPEDVATYGQEFAALQHQLRSTIGGTTSEIGGSADIDTPLGMFNGNTLFAPNATGTTIAIGQAVGQEINIPETNLRTGSMLDIINQDSGGAFTLDVNDPSTVDTINTAIGEVAGQRSVVGAAQSRLEMAGTTLQMESENLIAAVSRIRDVDVAEESTSLARYNILVQSGTAMLAQANLTPQSVLKLLQS